MAAWSRFINGWARNQVTRAMAPIAYADRPTAPVQGELVSFTDSNTATWGATVAAGGANKVLAVFNGTNWTVVGI